MCNNNKSLGSAFIQCRSGDLFYISICYQDLKNKENPGKTGNVQSGKKLCKKILQILLTIADGDVILQFHCESSGSNKKEFEKNKKVVDKGNDT